MAEIHTEIETVRSTVSTASSGYAIVSVPYKQRGEVKNVFPAYPSEPPPDYDDDSPVKERLMMETPIRQPSPLRESAVPLLSQENGQTDAEPQTIIRINSRSHDLNIEIVSNPTQSPASPVSTTGDSAFLYRGQSKNKRSGRKCCKLSTREKIFTVILITVLLALGLVIVNFTVCIGEFTSACD